LTRRLAAEVVTKLFSFLDIIQGEVFDNLEDAIAGKHFQAVHREQEREDGLAKLEREAVVVVLVPKIHLAPSKSDRLDL